MRGIRKNCNAFLVHRLAEGDDIWHDDGHWYVGINDFSELWFTFPGAQLFDSEYLADFMSERDEIWQRLGTAQ